MTSFHLLFGTHARMKDNFQIQKLLEKEWVEDFQNGRNDLQDHAKERIAKIQHKNRAIFNKKRKSATKYNENDIVAIKRTQLCLVLN